MFYPMLRYASRNRTASTIMGKALKAMRISVPERLLIHITDDCNLSCIYCYKKGQEKGDLNTERILELIDEAKRLNIREIELSGGEPFLHKDLYRIIKAVFRNRQSIILLTNGTFLDEEWVRRLRPFRKRLRIIFKADSPATYKRHTGKPFSSLVESNIRRCISSGIESIAFITVTKTNLDFLPDIIQRNLDMGSRILLERYIPMGVKEDRLLEISGEDFQRAIHVFYKELARHYRKPPRRLYEEMKNIALLTTPKFCFCYSNMMAIDTNGNVIHCPISSSKHSLGNVNSESLESIFRKIKESRKRINRIPDECKPCEHSEYCRGGCKTYSLHKNHPIERKDPFCMNNNVFFSSFNLQSYYFTLNMPTPKRY